MHVLQRRETRVDRPRHRPKMTASRRWGAPAWAWFVGLALHQVTCGAQAPAAPTYVATLKTPRFSARIEVYCPESDITCDHVV